MLQDARRCQDRLPSAVAAQARTEAGALETALFDLFERSRAAGRLGPASDSRALARFYTALARGVMGSDPEPLDDIARIGVGLLEAA